MGLEFGWQYTDVRGGLQVICEAGDLQHCPLREEEQAGKPGGEESGKEGGLARTQRRTSQRGGRKTRTMGYHWAHENEKECFKMERGVNLIKWD